jgi:short subunit fatty acids transporter
MRKMLLASTCLRVVRMRERFGQTNLFPLFFSLPALEADKATDRDLKSYWPCVFVLRRETA